MNGRRPALLAGVRVLDFSRYLSGPHCTRALSDLGADVVKVESPEGDFTQSIPPHSGGFSRFYTQQNAGKRNLCVDLRKPAGAELIKRLLPDVDVVVENFRPGVMGRFGLSYEECATVNPGLIYASITGWGQDGPESERPAFAIVVQAEAGLAAKHLDLYKSDHPVSDVFSHADLYSGLEALAAILAALYNRERNGTGQHIDVSMMATAVAVNEHASSLLDPDWPPDHVNRAPILRYRDQQVALTADPVEPVSFGRLAEAIGAPLSGDPRFSDQVQRVAHRDALTALVQEWVETFPTLADLEEALLAVRIPIGVVRSVRDVSLSPWAAHRRAFVAVPDGEGGMVTIPNSPWRFSQATAGVERGPAVRGEHNVAVASEAGYDAAEIAGLQRAEVLIFPPDATVGGRPGGG